MLAFLRSDERVGVVVAKIVFDSGQIHSFGMNIVGPMGVHDRGTRIAEPVGERTLDIAVERPYESEAEGGDAIAEVDGAIGCCTMFPRELAERIGGFDTLYDPVGFEDFDFALGARRLGRKVFFFPEVRVVHRVSLRNPRTDGSRRELWMWRARRRFGDAFPLWLRRRVAAAAKLGDHDPARIAMLRRHYASWRRKWGFDPLNPDMDEVLARYGGTEVCWAYDEELRAAGVGIVEAYLRRQAARLPSAE
jgi:GT2 family glycosyltransferase